MKEYPYINTTGKLREFVRKISDMGVPDSVTVTWLPTVGFGSTNHRRIPKVLRFIGFLEGNRPTSRWQNFRDSSKAPSIMAEAIQEGYDDLYRIYPDAHHRPDSDLKNFFKGQMSGGDQMIASTVATFKALCSFADFEAVVPEKDEGSAMESRTTKSPIISINEIDQSVPLVPLHIHLDLHISADATNAQIDQVFESMARHLYGRDTLAADRHYGQEGEES